jgi:RNA polymerase sigma-54 factor
VDEIADAAHVIASLEPKPSRGFGQEEVLTVLPDVFVEKIGNEYVIYLNDDGVPRLRVSSFIDAGGPRRGGGRTGAQYLQEGARVHGLIKAFRRRQPLRVTQSILNFSWNFSITVSARSWCFRMSLKTSMHESR